MSAKNLSERIANKKRALKESGYQTSTNKKPTSGTSSLRSRIAKKQAANKFNFDTFATDLQGANELITKIYGGWQTPETMKNSLPQIQSMYGRLNQYQRAFGDSENGAYISELQKLYKDVLDNWENRTSVYGNYKNADAYNAASKLSMMDSKYSGLTYDQAQAKKNEFSPNSFEYKYFDNYTKYDDLKEFDKAIEGKNTGKKINIPKDANINVSLFPQSQTKKSTSLEESLKSNLNTNSGMFRNPTTNPLAKNEYYENLVINNRDLEAERNKWSIEHKADLYSDLTQNSDFNEKSKFVSTKGVFDNSADKFTNGQFGLGYGDIVYEYINADEKTRNEIKKGTPTIVRGGVGVKSIESSSAIHENNYDEFYPEEIKLYNYLYDEDKKKGTNRATKFLEDMQMTLDARAYKKQTAEWKLANQSAGGIAINSLLSVPASVYGAGLTAMDSLSDAIRGQEYNPFSKAKMYTNYAQDTREYAGEYIKENTDFEIFGQNVPSFLYQTGMSMADNLLGAKTTGVAYLPLMGTNAFHQKAKELIEEGEDAGTVYSTALASGLAEMVFEKISLDRFLKIKGVDSKRAILKALAKQGVIEASEEFFTELSNILTDTDIRGESSELMKKYNELLERGYTKKEADTEIAKQVGSQIFWAATGGALSGGGMGMFGAIGNYSTNIKTGKGIKEDERTQDMIDLASQLTPDEYSAYETYSRYAKKGVDADNIKNAQLGRLFNETARDAENIMKSKKSTAEQKLKAFETMSKLQTVASENKVAKEKSKLTVGKETTVSDTGEKVTVQGIRVEGNDVVVKTNDGEISVEKMTLSDNDADLVAQAKVKAETDGEAIANVFIENYDGKMDLEDYNIEFEAVVAKTKARMSEDEILNKLNGLAGKQASSIYQATIKAMRASETTKINEAFEQAKKFIRKKGTINDKVFAYDNNAKKGQVNWGDLSNRQREAVTFTNGLFSALGNNIVWTVGQKYTNGAFSYSDNTFYIDVNATAKMGDSASAKDTIISTVSHELTHQMRLYSNDTFRKVADLVLDAVVRKNNGATTKVDLIARELSRLKKAHPDQNYNEEDAIDEIVARACEDMLSVSKAGRELFNSLSESEQKTLANRIKDLIKDITKWIDELLATYKSSSFEARALREMKKNFEEVSREWDKMLLDIAETNKAVRENKAESSEKAESKEVAGGKVKYSIRESYVKEISEWAKDGMPNGESFILGTTGDVLQGLGAIESDIYMLGDKIVEILKKHPEMTIEEIKKIPQILENPILILKSQNVGRDDADNTRLVIFGNIKAQDGKPILTVLDLKPIENNLAIDDMQKVTSAYTKDTSPVDFVKNSLVVYAEQKRTAKLLRTIGFSAPIELQYSGYIGSISYKDQNVNIEGEEFSKVFKKSKIMNSDKDSTGKELSKRYANTARELFTNKPKSGIQYQDKSQESIYDIMGENERLRKQNEFWQAEVDRLKERLALEKKVTNGNYFDSKQIGIVAELLRKKGNSDIDKVELMKALKGVYSYIAEKSNNIDEDYLKGKLREIAGQIVAESTPETVSNDYAKEILKSIRTARVTVSETQKAEAQHIFGKGWNRNFFGRANIVSEKGIPLEDMWKEWANEYPSYFDENISDADMLGKLHEIIGDLQDASELVQEFDKELLTNDLAVEIFRCYWNISPIKTTADKYTERINKLNAEHKKALAELRQELKDARKTGEWMVAEQKLADDIRFKRAYEQLRGRKDAQIAYAKQKGKERLDTYKENAERKARIQSITAIALSMNDMLKKNSKDKHIPDAMKDAVQELLTAIDFSSKRLLEGGKPTMNDARLANALKNLSIEINDSKASIHENLIDLYSSELPEKLTALVKTVDTFKEVTKGNEFILNAMSAKDLKTLDDMLKIMRHAVNDVNKFHVAQHNAGVESLGIQSTKELKARKKIYKDNKKHFDKLKTKTFWNNLTPYYAFKHMGKAAQKIFAAFQDGQDKMAFLAQEVIAKSEETYTAKEYKKWSKTFFDFEIVQPNGETKKFSMNVPQIMSLYCVSKQDDAKRHLLHGDKNGEGGGITIAETSKTESEPENILLTKADLHNIISKLGEVPKAKDVADVLQEYMGTRGAELGNEISMARWGIKSFGIENYFPIKVSRGQTPTKGETPGVQNNSLIALLNMSFTHSRNEYAAQSIEIGDFFDVFSYHMASMIQYNAMALPVLDAYKWMNVRGTDENGANYSVETSIISTFGDFAWEYLNKFMKDVNGVSKDETRDNMGLKFFKNAKVAKVAFNLRVIMLQFTSFIRAGAVMDNKYLLKAFLHKPKIAKSKEHCGIVAWKALGYYDTDITRPITAQIKHLDSVMDKLHNVSLWGAGKADEITLGFLWNACELEVRATRKDLKPGTDKFYKEVGLKLRDVVYQTQVVDSQLTRSQMMRGTVWDKMLTSFASENALSFNLVTDVFVTNKLDKRAYGKEYSFNKNKKRTRKAITAYAVTGLVTAALQTMFDAFRDYDEEDKDEKYILMSLLSNFLSNVSFAEKIPYINFISDATTEGFASIYDIVTGAKKGDKISKYFTAFEASRMETSWITSYVSALKELAKLTTEDGDWEKVLKNILKALSDSTGVAAYNIYRDVMAFIEMFND